MKKAPDAFRTISEVSDWLDTPAHVLRFWESKFSQVKPVKRAGGRRYYRPDDMRLLGGIKQLLHIDGLTIKGVQKILREQGVKHVASLSPEVADGPATPARKARPVSEIDGLTDEIAKKVASTAETQEKPSAPEPLKLGEETRLTKEDSAALQEAAAAAPKPAFASDEDVPLFLRREDQSDQTDQASAEPEQPQDPDGEKISELYGRLKSLRQRMQEA